MLIFYIFGVMVFWIGGGFFAGLSTPMYVISQALYLTVIFLLSYVLGIMYNRFFPVLELLPPGGIPWLTAWKKVAIAGIVAVGGLAGTAVINTVISNLMKYIGSQMGLENL
jgi:hypothetical protein